MRSPSPHPHEAQCSLRAHAQPQHLRQLRGCSLPPSHVCPNWRFTVHMTPSLLQGEAHPCSLPEPGQERPHRLRSVPDQGAVAAQLSLVRHAPQAVRPFLAGLGKAMRMRFTEQRERGLMKGGAPDRAHMGRQEAPAASTSRATQLQCNMSRATRVQGGAMLHAGCNTETCQ